MKKIGLLLGFLGFLGLLFLGGFAVVRYFSFKVHCKDYLKLASDAPTVERAAGFLEQAVSYIEEKGLTEGNSSWIVKTPTNDIGIWYEQLKSAQSVLRGIIEREGDEGSISQIERDNALMKLREVLLDVGESTTVTLPAYISLYPYQKMVMYWMVALLFVQLCWTAVFLED